jgi:hypothetical protein
VKEKEKKKCVYRYQVGGRRRERGRREEEGEKGKI